MLDVKQVAEKLSVSESTIRRLIDSGKLKVVKVGSQLRISDSEIERYLKVEGRKMEAVIKGKRYKTEGSTLIASITIEWNERDDSPNLKGGDGYFEAEWSEELKLLGKGSHDLYKTAKGNFFWVIDETRDDCDRIRPVDNPRDWFDLIQEGWGKTYVAYEEAFPDIEVEDA